MNCATDNRSASRRIAPYARVWVSGWLRGCFSRCLPRSPSIEAEGNKSKESLKNFTVNH